MILIDADVVTLSRLQFALTALYHFLFVPLTLGLVWMQTPCLPRSRSRLFNPLCLLTYIFNG